MILTKEENNFQKKNTTQDLLFEWQKVNEV